MDYNYGYNNYNNYDPQFNINMPVGGKRGDMFKPCAKLGGLLILYKVSMELVADLFFMITYMVLAKDFTLSYNAAIDGLKENYYDLVTSTTFTMLANLLIVWTSICIVFAVGKLVLGIELNGFLKPSAEGAKQGIRWTPACFVINMIISYLLYILVASLNNVGFEVPEADFTINQPSTLAVVMQFLYVVLLGPLAEELIYRGLILGMLSKYSKSAAVLLSALCFGLMHGNIPQAASAFLTGLMYSTIAAKCGSIMPSLVIHIVNNFLADFMDSAEAINLPNAELILCLVEIVAILFGAYVLMTRSRFLKSDEAPRDKQLARKAIFTNPVVLIYLALLVYEIVKDLIAANLQ